MIGGIFLFNLKGEVLIKRVFRDDIARNASDAFRINVIHSRKKVQEPVTDIARNSFLHIRREDIWIVAVTKQNVNITMVFQFLGSFAKTMKSYFGKFNEDKVKNNFVLVYELLDEMLDFGYPQNCDAAILKTYITQAGNRSEPIAQDKLTKITAQVTGTLYWRPDDIKYRNSLLFLDVVERINLLMSPLGIVLSAYVDGYIFMNSSLSGMPECKIGINDKLMLRTNTKIVYVESTLHHILIDDYKFHQCVKLSKYEDEHSIHFIPPDGQFELMRYRINKNICLPFKVIPIIQEVGGNFVGIKVILKTAFKSSISGKKIEMKISIPLNAAKVQVSCRKGTATYKAEENAIIWKIKKMSGMKETQLTADIDLLVTENEKKWVRPPISLSFTIPYAFSGFKVKYIRVFEPKLNYLDQDVTKWIRYFGCNGRYEIRC
ncbi:Clathrin adaptor, mu subunit, conserved site,Clathrin adaptor, mu subunit,Mu homology [Cinara cedri]|uniref:Clathrin adaptor, mu subunit, conserved site,Clathrin adaptor, mu subunit,Mu homology n=1 Tax=Cinara cedri TaxID=506608 RepID=A0A5E4MQL0_9HEMI|nr:Clathrin adaptor, mu subunit, conserved site,Clathrin adaptor, mu subunit,Mu homology [Cinara cedri]